MTLERTWYDCGVRSGGCIEMTMCGKDLTRMKCQNGIGNNNTQQYTPCNYIYCLDSFGTDIAHHHFLWGGGKCRTGR